MAKFLVHSFYHILYQPKGVPSSRDNFSGSGGTYLESRIPRYMARHTNLHNLSAHMLRLTENVIELHCITIRLRLACN